MRPVMPCLRNIPITLFVGGMCLLVAGCLGSSRKKSHSTPPVAPVHAQVSDGNIAAHNYRYIFPDQGPPVWVAEVETSHADAKTGLLLMHGISSTMLRQGRETLHVTADDGKALLQGKVGRISLSGHVTVTEPKRGVKMTADAFRWVTNEDTITATTIHSFGLGLDQHADHGVFSIDLTQANLDGHVRIETSEIEEKR